MPVYKDTERGTWYVSFSVKDQTTGKFKHKKKRGFKTAPIFARLPNVPGSFYIREILLPYSRDGDY